MRVERLSDYLEAGMAAYTIHTTDGTQRLIDAEVERRKAKRRGPDAAQLAEATRLAKTKGAQAANEYLKGLKGVKVSRLGVTVEMLELGLAAHAAGWAPGAKGEPRRMKVKAHEVKRKKARDGKKPKFPIAQREADDAAHSAEVVKAGR